MKYEIGLEVEVLPADSDHVTVCDVCEQQALTGMVGVLIQKRAHADGLTTGMVLRGHWQCLQAFCEQQVEMLERVDDE